MLRMFAVLVGIVFIFIGVAGFLPQFMKDGLLFGFFEVNSMHSIVHVASGVFAIMAATKYSLTKLFFEIFGLVYGLVAIAGFVNGGNLYLMHVNMADNILHTAFAVIFLWVGFAARRRTV